MRPAAESGSRWHWWRGLRMRMALSITAILIVSLGTAFLATYRGTGIEVRAQIDDDLREDAAAFEERVPWADVRPERIARRAQRFLDERTSFGATTRLYIVRIRGGGTVSNLPELNPDEGDLTVDRSVAGPRRESD